MPVPYLRSILMETLLNFLITFLSADWLIFLNQRNAYAQKSYVARKLSGVNGQSYKGHNNIL